MERQQKAADQAGATRGADEEGDQGGQDLDFTAGAAPKLRRGSRADAEAERPSELGYTRQITLRLGVLGTLIDQPGMGVGGSRGSDGGPGSPIPHTARPIFPNGNIAV